MASLNKSSGNLVISPLEWTSEWYTSKKKLNPEGRSRMQEIMVWGKNEKYIRCITK